MPDLDRLIYKASDIRLELLQARAHHRAGNTAARNTNLATVARQASALDAAAVAAQSQPTNNPTETPHV